MPFLSGKFDVMPVKNIEPIERYVIEVVKKMRIEKEISQRELAFRLDVSIGFIGDVEGNKRKAKYNLKHINKLAQIFGCAPKDFLPDKPLTR